MFPEGERFPACASTLWLHSSNRCRSAQNMNKPFSLRRLNSPGVNPKLYPGVLNPLHAPWGRQSRRMACRCCSQVW